MDRPVPPRGDHVPWARSRGNGADLGHGGSDRGDEAPRGGFPESGAGRGRDHPAEPREQRRHPCGPRREIGHRTQREAVEPGGDGAGAAANGVRPDRVRLRREPGREAVRRHPGRGHRYLCRQEDDLGGRDRPAAHSPPGRRHGHRHTAEYVRGDGQCGATVAETGGADRRTDGPAFRGRDRTNQRILRDHHARTRGLREEEDPDAFPVGCDAHDEIRPGRDVPLRRRPFSW